MVAKMSNILIVCPHFPALDVYTELSKDPRSKFLLEYIQEWVSMGHTVTVIHLPPKYPSVPKSIVNIISRFFPKYKRVLTKLNQNPDTLSRKKYRSGGVDVIRWPIFKLVPHSRMSVFRLNRTTKSVKENFKICFSDYDVIFLDYLSPSVDFASLLNFKEGSHVFPIIHLTDKSYFDKYRAHYTEKINSISSKVLYRNAGLLSLMHNNFDHSVKSDFIYSGIPSNVPVGVSRVGKVSRFIFVGRLIESKNIHNTIKAFHSLMLEGYNNFSFEIVGDGYYRDDLERLVKKYKLSDYVFFSGSVPREQVLAKMSQSDALLMVTEETFGMVYVEAMSQGCIVLAAKGQGIDGIVVDGINGFLTPLNEQDLLFKSL